MSKNTKPTTAQRKAIKNARKAGKSGSFTDVKTWRAAAR